VNASIVIVMSSQTFFMWILIGLLVIWMVTFAVLALRPAKPQKEKVEEATMVYDSASTPSAPPLVHAEV
jgi:hypothetical protein